MENRPILPISFFTIPVSSSLLSESEELYVESVLVDKVAVDEVGVDEGAA